MSKPEERPLMIEFKSKLPRKNMEQEDIQYRHDVAAFDHGIGGAVAPFYQPPSIVKLVTNFDHQMRDGQVFNQVELLAHIANLQAIAGKMYTPGDQDGA